jgi:prolyl oligopeptidase
MQRTSFLGGLLLAGFLVCGMAGSAALASGPPVTRTDAVADTLHGRVISDPYRWLEDQNSPETREWIDQQNAYTRSIVDTMPGREYLVRRLGELLKTDVVKMPTERNGRYFLMKRSADQDQAILYMRDGIGGEDQVLVDPHEMSADHSVSVGLSGVSADGRVIAYLVRRGGADEEAIFIMNVDTREHYADSLPAAVYFGMALTDDLSGYYYAQRRPEGPRVFYHAMGTDPGTDRMVFGEGYDDEKIIACDISENGRWLLIHVYHGSSGRQIEIYFQDLHSNGPIMPLVNDIEARFSGQIAGDRIFLLTDWDAPNSRILSADLTRPARENWTEVIPAGPDALESCLAAGGKLSVVFIRNVQSVVKIFEPDGTFVREIELPTIGTVDQISGRWASPELFISFESFHYPPTIFRCDLAQNTREVWARRQVPVNTDEFEVEQVWYTSYDSTRVPMFLVHKKGIVLDGSNPVIMYGYGGFNISMTPYFSNWVVTFVELGGIYVATNLRGGGEFGLGWHEAGMFEKKQNTFDDLYAGAEYLISQGYTSSGKLAVFGGSNGGLLVGAALTQRPELFRAVLCTYPLLDMLRYHKFLMGPYWVSEYGSAGDSAQFAYISKYSPYQNVRPGTNYPAVMFVTGDADTRVDPMHARKMTALLQASTGSADPIVLHYDTKAGHSGGTPVGKQIEDYADHMLFMFRQVGVTPR